MNQRLLDLARNAGISILYEYDGYDGHAAVANLADIEKFAKLIVEECFTKLTPYMDDQFIDDVEAELNHHFGVE